jgi:hypothetical protein
MTARIELSEADKQSAAWGKVQAYLTQRLSELRTSNDRDMAPDMTNKLRGQIAEVKALQGLGIDRPNL